ncbi:MAG: hypothetical protein DRJ31_09185 [Candidatus Methanomethylicota archaeon]|uniref:Glycosyl transferase family 1 domain-containing protein n=1 Tax=Thermoproteota archaeon TaxID=2056631 RepID=A0A497EM92_9CREN|nr:MAG: hypothetical protein DRJ31_09185 [Candidatus Verstraetearchaeota archaeon]
MRRTSKTLIEAMACSLPVVDTDFEDIREVLVVGFNGLLREPDTKSIREALVKLLTVLELGGLLYTYGL